MGRSGIGYCYGENSFTFMLFNELQRSNEIIESLGVTAGEQMTSEFHSSQVVCQTETSNGS